MPGIWNVNNSYNVNNSNKKISSKLTFNIGEKFSGKIIKNGDDKDVSIKLTDGWEFSAELDGDLDSLGKVFQRFEVEGFKDGKLKLKLINKENEASQPNKGELNDIINKEGLSKKDIPLLEAMLKYDIPLSTENIKMVKGLIQFNDKIQGNPKEIEAFISKYLESKGINSNSLKGQEITQKLEQFLNAFKSLSKEEVLLFLENNIEFTKENIESYNKLFKESGKVSNIIYDMKNELNLGNTKEINSNESINNKLDPAKSETLIGLENNKQNVKSDSLNIKNDSSKLEISNNKLATVTYEKNDIVQNKVSMLSLLKSIIGGGEEQLNIELKDLINNRRAEFTTKEFDNIYNKINKIDYDSFISMLKDSINEYNSNNQGIESTSMDCVNKRIDEEKFGNGELSFNKVELESTLSNIIGKNITLTEEEFSKIKDIINLKISDSENSSNKDTLSKNTGDIIEKTIQESSKDKGTINLKSDNTENLKELIKDKLSSQEIVKNNISSKGEEGKEIIKSILSSLKDESISEKILDVIKNNISDIKLFNKINQEYYYLDVPVNINKQEYPCKLILKDNRKDGKKIDSTNVKMVVTVKTASIGTVDGYIKVLERKIDIDLKCENSFVKMLDLGKGKLASDIKSLGFNVAINVSKREDEISLATCREFFNENNRANIDIKV